MHSALHMQAYGWLLLPVLVYAKYQVENSFAGAGFVRALQGLKKPLAVV